MKKRRYQPHATTWAVPLRRVFPWWYLAGFVGTFVLLELLGAGQVAGVEGMWGPVIGLEIARRQQIAAQRKQDGLSLDRKLLRGRPSWVEPSTAALFVVVDAGIALASGFAFGGVPRPQEQLGVVFLVAGVFGVLALAIWARRNRRRRREPSDAEQ